MMKSALTHLAAILLASQSLYALEFEFTGTDGMDADALAGFNAAADFWSSQFTDDVTINIEIGFSTLGAGILGSTSSTTQYISISDFYTSIAADATSADDLTSSANLSPLAGNGKLSFITQTDSENGSMLTSLDSDNSGNNLSMDINTANAKAIGLFDGSSTSDGSIVFSDTFPWDFDASDGIDGDKYDFVGVAVHEIGHALGFVSGVDTVDFAVSNDIDLENYRVFTPLDMFRYADDSGTLNLAAGADAYLSIDGGQTAIASMSTGSANGDGQQASHWKDNLDIGALDPTLALGEIVDVTSTDLLAFDIIGWDLAPVPEPASFLFISLAGIGAMSVRRRKVAC
ncbi:NF038122 family metalloprotease [Persicirhabdus sediminis]|uniref:NF038122 family metalloprotease n=1 Tax=Persicirhabdus sediminis TaxID=454144 RepID=A0A8J7MDA7_9BACT|nr:NF038122 family metalloprotease [Persicirhabdus sediminis]MBK1790460.1 NF038122 family metalloprotease [Persicirhabdus sediminis]